MGFGKDGKGIIIRESRSQAVGTLATQVPLIVGTNLATLECFRMLKGEVAVTVIGATAGDLNNLWFGLADGDLSGTEIDECLEANGPLGPNDIILSNRALRPVWLMGSVTAQANANMGFTGEDGGTMLNVVPRWTFASTKSWNWFVYNLGSAPTSGASILIRTKLFGVWVT